MNLCRICLIYSTEKDISQLKLYVEGPSKSNVDIFHFCFNILINTDTDVNTKLCKSCFDKVISFYQFKCLALRSDAYLRTPKPNFNYEVLLEDTIKNEDPHLNGNDSNTIPSQESQNSLDVVVKVKKEVVSDDDSSQNCETDDVSKFLKQEIREDEGNSSGDQSTVKETNVSAPQQIKDPQTFTQETIKPQNKSGKSQVCKDCGKTVKKMRAHRLLHKPLEDRKRFECEECHKMFLSDSARIRHHKVKHLGMLETCTTCNKVVANLRQHDLVMHNNSLLRFACNLCDRRYRAQALLDVHMSTHTNERNYLCKCDICDKDFVSKYVLLKHKQQVHEKVKSHVCEYCQKSFFEKSNLKLHLRTHTKEKPYKCTVCGKKCGNSIILKKHLLTHSDVKTYSCDYCGKAFKTPSNLRQHINCHTKEKQYDCSFCELKFLRNDQRKRHEATAHVTNETSTYGTSAKEKIVQRIQVSPMARAILAQQTAALKANLGSQDTETDLMDSQDIEANVMGSQESKAKLMGSQNTKPNLMGSQDTKAKLMGPQDEQATLTGCQDTKASLMGSQDTSTREPQVKIKKEPLTHGSLKEEPMEYDETS